MFNTLKCDAKSLKKSEDLSSECNNNLISLQTGFLGQISTQSDKVSTVRF